MKMNVNDGRRKVRKILLGDGQSSWEDSRFKQDSQKRSVRRKVRMCANSIPKICSNAAPHFSGRSVANDEGSSAVVYDNNK